MPSKPASPSHGGDRLASSSPARGPHSGSRPPGHASRSRSRKNVPDADVGDLACGGGVLSPASRRLSDTVSVVVSVEPERRPRPLPCSFRSRPPIPVDGPRRSPTALNAPQLWSAYLSYALRAPARVALQPTTISKGSFRFPYSATKLAVEPAAAAAAAASPLQARSLPINPVNVVSGGT